MSNRKTKIPASQGRKWIEQAMSWSCHTSLPGHTGDRQLRKLMALAGDKFEAIARMRSGEMGEAVLLLSELIVLLQQCQMRDTQTSDEVHPSGPPEDN
jgi:hypothetical protein